MKKLVCILAILAATPLAFASKARLEALGQGSNGSYFIKDSRNVFLNPATITSLSNQVNLEVGSNTTSPKAEGGLTHKADFGSLGLHLGRLGMGAQNILDAEGSITGLSLFNPQNSLEFLYGREMGNFNMGAALHYSNSESDVGETANLPDSSASITTLRVGAETDMFGAYLTYGLTEESKTEDVGNTVVEYDGSNSMKLGGVYNFSDTTKVSAEIMQVDYKWNTGTATGERGQQEMSANFYNQLAGDDNFFVFYTIGLTQAEYTIDYDAVGVDDIEDKRMYMPVVIGGEAKVKEWLTLRASVKQNTILDERDYKDNANNLKTSNLDDTVVAAGLGLNFGRVTIDSVFEGARTGSGRIDGNEFLAKAALKYTY